MIYRYLAINPKGHVFKGFRIGRSVAHISKKLTKKDFTILSVSSLKTQKRKCPHRRIKIKTLCFFADQMSQLIESNLSLPQSITVIKKTLSENHELHPYLEDINLGLSRGLSLSEAFAPDIGYWGPIMHISLRCIDHSLSGNLAANWRMIAQWAYQMHEIRKSFLQALTYPALIAIFSVIIILALLIFVVPSFETLFNHLLSPNSEIPFATSLLIKTSLMLRHYYLLIICIICTAIISSYYIARTNFFQSLLGKISTLNFIKFIFGDSRPVYFFDSLHFLLKSGLKLAQAIEYLQTIELFHGSPTLFQKALAHLKTGKSFSSWMKTIDFFQPTIISLVQSAETAGSFRESFEKISKYEHTQFQQRVKTCIALIEPCAIFILTGIIGLFILLLFQPIWTLIDQL